MPGKTFIILPAFNEEKSIGKLLIHIEQSMDDSNIRPYEVVVVNDGSEDETLYTVQQLQQRIPISILTHEVNQGLGATLRDGLFEASKRADDRDIIVTMDADDTHIPGLILRMIRMLREGCDVVIASRYRPGSRVIGLSIYRKLLSLSASWLFRLLFPIPGVRDFTSGFRAYKASVIKTAIQFYGDDFVDQDGFQCMVDILLKLRKMNLIFREVPMILRYDLKEGKSKMNIKTTTINTLKLVIKRATK